MRRELPTIVLSSAGGALVALSLGFYWGLRPGLVTLYADAPEPAPWAAQIVLGGWFFPSVVFATLLLGATAMTKKKRSLRLKWLAFAVGLAGACFVAAALAVYVPLLG